MMKIHQSVQYTERKHITESKNTVHPKAINNHKHWSHISNIWSLLTGHSTNCSCTSRQPTITFTHQLPATSRTLQHPPSFHHHRWMTSPFQMAAAHNALTCHNLEWHCAFQHVQHFHISFWEQQDRQQSITHIQLSTKVLLLQTYLKRASSKRHRCRKHRRYKHTERGTMICNVFQSSLQIQWTLCCKNSA